LPNKQEVLLGRLAMQMESRGGGGGDQGEPEMRMPPVKTSDNGCRKQQLSSSPSDFLPIIRRQPAPKT